MRENVYVLIVFVGMPGTGKTTLADLLAAERKAARVRVDAIEAAMVRAGLTPGAIGPAGYFAAQEVASACLAVGAPVVADSVSPVPEARHGWTAVADNAGVPLKVVEVEVSDHTEHRRRIEQRRSDIDGLTVPTWEQVLRRAYEPWNEERDGPRLTVCNDGAVELALAGIRAYIDHE